MSVTTFAQPLSASTDASFANLSYRRQFPTDSRVPNLNEIENILNYRFKDFELAHFVISLLRAQPRPPEINLNGRSLTIVQLQDKLEYIGDGIVGVAACHEIQSNYNWRGFHRVVSNENLKYLAMAAGLRSLLNSAPDANKSLANWVEIAFGAVYLDGGVECALKTAGKFINIPWANQQERNRPSQLSEDQIRIFEKRCATLMIRWSFLERHCLSQSTSYQLDCVRAIGQLQLPPLKDSATDYFYANAMDRYQQDFCRLLKSPTRIAS